MLYRDNRRYIRLRAAFDKADKRLRELSKAFGDGSCTFEVYQEAYTRYFKLSRLLKIASRKNLYRASMVSHKLADYAFSIGVPLGESLTIEQLKAYSSQTVENEPDPAVEKTYTVDLTRKEVLYLFNSLLKVEWSLSTGLSDLPLFYRNECSCVYDSLFDLKHKLEGLIYKTPSDLEG